MTERRICWLLFAAVFCSLLLTERPVGFTRDESVYFHAAESHGRWFALLLSSPSQAVTEEATTRAFDFNHEHPALMKNLFGISYVVLHEKLGLLRPAAAFRVPAFLFAAWLAPLVYLLSRKLFGREASVFAALSFFLVPRQFYHSHLACFDVPIAVMWVLTVYCFVEALSRPRWWLWAGLAFGLALGTKHNAYFIPAALVPFVWWRGWQLTKDKPEARGHFLGINAAFAATVPLYAILVLALGPQKFGATFTLQSPHTIIYVVAAALSVWLTWRLRALDEATFRTIAPLVAMAVLGPVVFYVHWPYLWHHPVDRTAWYLNFHLTHNHYTWFYLGALLREPPFPLEYVLVKTALTVRLTMLLPMVLGLVWIGRKIKARTVSMLELILAMNGLLSIALISLPSVPHFGGVKHWFPSMPFLALLGAGAVERAAKWLFEAVKAKAPRVTERLVFVALALFLSSSAVIATARVYEFGTSAYGELAGGLPGAASLGMQRQYWSNNLTGVLEWLNANARPGERVYFHENHGGQVRDFKRNKLLREDLVPVGNPESATLVTYQYHQEFRDAEFATWQAFGTARPVYGLYVDETPQIVVYRRP